MQTTDGKRTAKLFRDVGIALATACLLGSGLALAIRQSRIQHQRQVDPAVAAVWLLQTTQGPKHTITRGSMVQRWANAHGIHALGDYQQLTSSFNGEPDGIEFWFDYDSYTSVKELECHRVGPTAFVDDLGQVYHGFLDFQGKTVGVYLPGYDHAAHRISCTLRWMPRRPHAPTPLSHPMTFTVPLPASKRVLPPASTLPDGPVSVTKEGITVTVSDAHLGPAKLRTYTAGQRDLMFHLKIQGGEIADDNIAISFGETSITTTTVSQGRIVVQNGGLSNRKILTPRFSSGGVLYTVLNLDAPGGSFTVTDPYGVSLVPGSASVTMPAPASGKEKKRSDWWVAPVNGTGRGTDCVRLLFHVQPPARVRGAMPPAPVDFEIPVRVAPSVTP